MKFSIQPAAYVRGPQRRQLNRTPTWRGRRPAIGLGQAACSRRGSARRHLAGGDGMSAGAHLTQAAPLLVTRELTKSFRSLVALRNHAIEVRAGEIVGVIGPNGSGKTTFFNLVTGFIKPNTGRVEFAGQEIQHLAPPAIVRLGIARTFQGTRLFPRLSVIENLRAAAQLRHRLGLVDVVLGLPRLASVGRAVDRLAAEML